MKLNEIKATNNKTKKRVGRGIAAGGGKTAGRGTKGQKSRSGFNIPRKFEGGQTPLNMRLHKLPGFKSHRHKNQIVSFDDINQNYKDGEIVSVKSLVEKGLILAHRPVKILANGDLKVKIKISDIKLSRKAQDIYQKLTQKNN